MRQVAAPFDDVEEAQMKRILLVIGTLLVASVLLPAQQKKRVAILNFDYATVQSGVAAIFGSNQDIGKGIADLLVDKLVSNGTYSVIERKMLDKIIAEQNFSNSDRADPNSAAKIGKLLGVDAIVIGSITQFGRDDKNTTVGGGALGGITGRFGVGGVSKKESKAVVAITARMVSTDTAEILASATGKGESTRSGTGLLGSGGSSAGAGGAGLDMHGSNFANSILGEAVNGAVNSVAQQLEAKAGSMPTKTVTIDGLVADAASDGTLVINVGSSAGVKVGDKLAVKRVGRKITDPATGKVIRQVEDAIGEMTVTEVDAGSAVGKFSGSGTAKVGDVVKSK
jgi:curli biogenesis system outer membrane secretion channel CsgG